MKKITIIALIGILFLEVVGQTLIKEIDFTTDTYFPILRDNYPLIEKIDDNRFIVVKKERIIKDSLIVFNQDLEQIYRLKCFHRHDFKYWSINRRLNELLVITYNNVSKKEVYLVVMKHNLENGEYISKKEIPTNTRNEFKYFKISDNNKYILLSEYDKKNREYVFSFYDIDCNLIRKINFPHSFSNLKFVLTNNGEVYFHSLNRNKNIVIYKINIEGNVENIVLDFDYNQKIYENFMKKIHIDEENHKIVLIFPEYDNKNLTRIKVFTSDLDFKNIKYIYTELFTEEYLNTLYNRLNENDKINSKLKPKKKLSNFQITNIVTTKNGIIIVSEGISESIIMGHKEYLSPTSEFYRQEKSYRDKIEDLLISNLSYSGENVWNSVIIRRMSLINESEDLLQTKIILRDNSLLIISCERGNMKYVASYVRKLNIINGSVSSSYRLPRESYYTIPQYVELTKPNTLTMVTTDKVLLTKKLLLRNYNLEKLINE